MLQLFAMSGAPVCVTRSTDLTGKIEQRVNVLGQANTQFFTSGKLINLIVFFFHFTQIPIHGCVYDCIITFYSILLTGDFNVVPNINNARHSGNFYSYDLDTLSYSVQ